MTTKKPVAKSTPKPKTEPGNGWRSGQDPIQRWLRIIASIVCLIVFAWLALDPERRDWPTLTIALGALLVLLGYEAIVRLPYLGRADNPTSYPTKTDDRPDDVIATGDDETPEE